MPTRTLPDTMVRNGQRAKPCPSKNGRFWFRLRPQSIDARRCSPATPRTGRRRERRPGPKDALSGWALIWLTVVKRKKRFLPTVFQRSLFGLFSKAPKEAEPVLRRLITLIFAGWLPHDLASSRSGLGLVTGVRPKAYPIVPSRVLLTVVAPLWLPWNLV